MKSEKRSQNGGDNDITVKAESEADGVALAKSKIETVALVVVAGFAISVLYHYWISVYADRNVYPYNTFLFLPNDRFNDFYNIFKATVGLDPYHYTINGTHTSIYFPFTYILMFPLTAFGENIAFFLFAASFILFFAIYVYRNLSMYHGASRATLWFILTFMSYPFLLLMDRGNLETWVFICMVMFFYLFKIGKENLSLLFLAMAISLKFYPAYLLLFLFAERRYKAIILTLGITAVLTIGGAALLKGGIMASYEGEKVGMADANNLYLGVGTRGLQHSAGLYTPLKLWCYNVIIHRMDNIPANFQASFNKYYNVVSAFLLLIITGVIVRYKMPGWHLVSLLILSCILLPISGDYKLIHLFIPLIFFINSPTPSRYDRPISLIFGLLLIPKDYVYIANDLSISPILNPLLILAFTGLVIFDVVRTHDVRKLFNTD